MKEEELQEIFEEQPDSRLWTRLESKLEKKRSLKKLRYYKVGSIAAMLALVIGAVSYFNHYLQDHNPHLFASNEAYSAFVLEELEYEPEGFFNITYFNEIRSAYNKKVLNNAALDVLGTYKAENGEISFEILLDNFDYKLKFEYSDFPELRLADQNGQTLYFESITGNKIKMNKETYGLKMLEADFLPEYSQYAFYKMREI